MNLIIISFISLSTVFLCGAEKQVARLLITPYSYVDSERWLKHVATNRDDFQTYAISFEDKPFIQNALNPFFNDDADKTHGFLQSSQVIIVNTLKNCIKSRPVNFTDKLINKELGVMPEGSALFIGLLCAIQFYKFINYFQLHIGEYIQMYYEEETPSAFFRQYKQDILSEGLFDQVFYQNIFRLGSQVFNNSKAMQVVDLTKNFDFEISRLSYNSTYNTTMVELFDRYLHCLNSLFFQETRNARL